MVINKYNVLFVDDEENNLIAFRHAFFRYYQVFTALSATQALEILKKNPIHLVITDQRMPGITGLEFLKTVKQEYPAAIRMIITGYSDVEVVMQAFNELGIYHYAMKPWNNQELKIIIDNALVKYQLTQDNNRLISKLTEANESLEKKVSERTAQLEAKNLAYKQLNQVKDKLFSIVSHDLRSPLASLSSFMDTYLKYKGVFTEEETHKVMTDIQISVVNLKEMLNNLLNWSRAQMDDTTAVISPAPINATLTGTLVHYRQIARQKQISLETNLTEGDKLVNIDQNMTALVLRNLVSNAIKFTPAYGTVTVSSVQHGSFVKVSVTDTGLGIPEEKLSMLFSDEYLITSPGTANERGTGLGLKLCREFVEKQGGKISVKSEPNKGSIFSFTVPVSV